MIVVVAMNAIKKPALDEFKSLAAELVAETRKEQGCIDYELYCHTEKKRVYSFIEKWDNRECLDRHVVSAHFKRLVPKLNKCCRKPGTVDRYEIAEYGDKTVPDMPNESAANPARKD